MSKRTVLKPMLRALSLVLTAALLASACGSSDGITAAADVADTAAEATAVPVATTAPVAIPADEPTETVAPAADATPAPTEAAASTETAAEDATAEATTETTTTTGTATTTATTASASVDASGLSCDAIAARFVTKGSANANFADPFVAATCTGDNVVVTSNQIPDFPYIETSPGRPQEYDLEFTIPATPVLAGSTSQIAALGAIAVAINGIPIFGATEGTGGDVLSLGSGFTECGGHNGPSGYHFHTFDVTGSDSCLFSEAEASAAPVLFGYAFDGFPIYGGNFLYTSSWELTDASLFATDTFSAHTYIPGSGDLDECNGRTDENGNYAYYTTETFPYTLGCYAGVVSDANGGAGGGAGPGGGGQGGPPPGDAAEGDAPAGPPPGDAAEGDAPAGPPPGDGEAPEGGAPAGEAPEGAGPGGGGGGGGGQGGGPDLSEAAATLGVTVEALGAALGQPPFDFDAAAAALGVTAEALEAAIPAPPGRPGG